MAGKLQEIWEKLWSKALLHAASVSALHLCVSHNEMTDRDLSGVVPLEALLHFDSLCLHNTSLGKRAHLHQSSHNTSHGLLPLDRSHHVYSNSRKKEQIFCWQFAGNTGNKSIGTVNRQITLHQLTGQVACEWQTNSQVKALWVKDTFILDTSWANKDWRREERGRVKERKAEGVESKTASLLCKNSLWKSP